MNIRKISYREVDFLLSILAPVSCADCSWQGTEAELDLEPGKSEEEAFDVCPVCASSIGYRNDSFTVEDIEAFFLELTSLCLEFNRVKQDRYSANTSIDMHKKLGFSVYDHTLLTEGLSTYLVAGGYGIEFEVDSTVEGFDYTVARDWVDGFARIINLCKRTLKEES